MMGQLQVFTGNAHPALAQAIANQLGLPLGAAIVTEYKNGETRVCIEENVRRVGCVCGAAHLPSGEPEPDGTADNDGRHQACIGHQDNGGHTILRICKAGEEKPLARADYGQACSGFAAKRRGAQDIDVRSARARHRGILQYPGRPSARAQVAGRQVQGARSARTPW